MIKLPRLQDEDEDDDEDNEEEGGISSVLEAKDQIEGEKDWRKDYKPT